MAGLCSSPKVGRTPIPVAQPVISTGQPRIVFIGSTGTGKSTTCNTLIGASNAFGTSDGIDSCTFLTTVKQNVHWAPEIANTGAFTLVDTPGLGDAQNRDSDHIAAMVAKLKELGSVNAFVLVFNGQNPRMDEGVRAMMKIFAEVFGADYLQHAILCFTRWSRDRKSLAGRPADAEERTACEFNTLLSREFGTDSTVPCVFIDNDYSKPSVRNISEPAELEANAAQLRELGRLATSFGPFECKGISAVLSERDQLRAERDAAEQQRHDDAASACDREQLLLRELERTQALLATQSTMPTPCKLFVVGNEDDNDDSLSIASTRSAPLTPPPSCGKMGGDSSGGKFYKGGQFTPGGGRAPKGGCYLPVGGSGRAGVSCARSAASGGAFYKGGQFMPGGGRAPKGGCYA